MVQLAAVFSAEPPPSPGFAALLNWRSAFRAFVDRRVRVVPLRVIVPHTAFTAAEFLPRDVARWNEALPTVQTGQFIYHEAIPLACFFHLTTQGKVQDYLTLTVNADTHVLYRADLCCYRNRGNRSCIDAIAVHSLLSI